MLDTKTTIAELEKTKGCKKETMDIPILSHRPTVIDYKKYNLFDLFL